MYIRLGDERHANERLTLLSSSPCTHTTHEHTWETTICEHTYTPIGYIPLPCHTTLVAPASTDCIGLYSLRT
jgi:hypothetical protein